jgi:glycerol-3-phosphate dehydrogenase
VALARRYDVDLPICEQVHDVLYEGCAIDEAVQLLLSRRSSQETR